MNLRTISAIAKDELKAIMEQVRTAKKHGLKTITYPLNDLFDEMVPTANDTTYERNAGRFNSVVARIEKTLKTQGYDLLEDDLVLTIKWRNGSALVDLLQKHCKENDTNIRGGLRDVLTDLRHIVDDENLDFDEIDNDAYVVYLEEKRTRKA